MSLLQINQKLSRNRYKKNNIICFLLLGIGAIIASFTVFRTDSDIKLIVLVVGILYVIIALVLLRKANTYNTCVNMIDNGERSIDNIAMSCGKSYEETVKIINELIQKNLVSGIHIDMVNRIIATKEDAAKSKADIQITCPNCHATTSTKKGICEYCGASLQ